MGTPQSRLISQPPSPFTLNHLDAKASGFEEIILPKPAPRIAYMMSRFPKITETFIINEIIELRDLGFDINIYPLLQDQSKVTHPEVESLSELIHYLPFISWKIIKANFTSLFQTPSTYIKTIMEILIGTSGSMNFFIGALGILPKSICFAKQMQRHNIQHIHAHFATHPTVAALIIHRLTGITFSFTCHGSDIHIDQTMFKQKAAAAKFIVAISKYNREFLVERCGHEVKKNMLVVNTGVNVSRFKLVEREPGNMLNILMVATFREVKGHRFLIEACRRLLLWDVPLQCNLVGSGPWFRTIKNQIARLNLKEYVKFHGDQPAPEVAKMMQQADVVVLPSIYGSRGDREGIPVVLMEAMASGCAVVASKISGIPELVEDGVTGTLCPPKNCQALALALKELARDPFKRKRYGFAGCAKVQMEFDLKKNVRRLAAEMLSVVMEESNVSTLVPHKRFQR